MSNNTRRQDLGLGKTAGGGSGGSFAAHERGVAAPPPVSVAEETVLTEPFSATWVERNVLPSPRHRKLRDVDRRFDAQAEFRSTDSESMDEAFTIPVFRGGSGDIESEYRAFDGKLYTPLVAGDIWSYSNPNQDAAPYPNSSDYVEATPEQLLNLVSESRRDWETGEVERVSTFRGAESEEEAREKVAEKASEYLVVDGNIWTRTHEPVYEVQTYGMGNNHGGTSLRLETRPMCGVTGNPLIREDNTFTLDEFEAAQQHALNTAKGRGDTESLQHIKDHRRVDVPADRTWEHPTAVQRISGHTEFYDIPYEQRDDIDVHRSAFEDLKRRIANVDGAVYTDTDGSRRVDFQKVTESVERNYQRFSVRMRELDSPKNDRF